jgi:hypothetical protein
MADPTAERPSHGRGGAGAGGRQPAHGRARKARTSLAAALSLALGACAALATVTVVLAPLGLVLGVVSVLLGLVGVSRSRVPHVTGRAVAAGGATLGGVAALVAAAVVTGLFAVLADPGLVDTVDGYLRDLASRLPTEMPRP